jgi:uncharacterized protein VirK/YbjX
MAGKHPPSTWHGVRWALERGRAGGGLSRGGLGWRAFSATVAHGKALRRWMTVLHERQQRGLLDDLQGEYLRAVRPYVQRHTGVEARVNQLIDHVDWMDTAFQPDALKRLSLGKPVILAELPAPRGCEYMRLQVQRSSATSPEGELVLTLTLRRSADIQPNALPVDVAALGFSRFRIDGLACFVIGGVRGQRSPAARLSAVELGNALQGWKPPVFMVRVAQELARYWNLHLVALNPASHTLQGWPYRWSRRYRDAAQRIYESYDALWQHFDAKNGPLGWVVVPLNSDEKLEATALSPEKRARQTRRADFWLRTRNLLRHEFRHHLVRTAREVALGRATENLGPRTIANDRTDWNDLDDDAFQSSEDMVPSRAFETGPGSLL